MEGISLLSCGRLARRAGLALFAAVMLHGCATPTPATKPRGPTSVVVLQSDASPAYASVTREIIKQWQGKVKVKLIQADKEDRETGARAQASPETDIIAIGLPAARIARSLTGKKVVFCQVFNYEGENLIKPWMKGVSALPPVRQQFKAWKELDPTLRKIAVIAGPGLKALMAEAQAAAREHGIELKRIVVHSNLALRAASTHLGQDVQGLWLVPDNRVLSHRVIQEVLSQNRARGRRVLVMNEQLLAWGATLSAESEPADIARQVIARVHAAAGMRTVPGAAVAPLTRTNVRKNPKLRESRASPAPAHG